MIKRVVAYGCSHAWGSEMSGRFNDAGNREFVFGNLVAKHYGVPFHRVAQPGNSNEGILHNVIEHCEEGDLSIFSSIQLRRSVYHPMSGNDPIGPQTISQYEAGLICEENNAKLPWWLEIKRINQTKDVFAKQELTHKLLEHRNDPHVPVMAEYFIGYRWDFLPLFMDYLKFYASWNAIAYSRGSYPVNFISFESRTKLRNMVNLEKLAGSVSSHVGKGPHFRNAREDQNYTNERMPHTLNTSKHYLDWLNDPTRICKGDLCLLGWVLQQQGLDPDKFPDNRMGHVGKEQQLLIADEIIKRCEELGYE